MADGHRQHDALVRHRARPAHPALGADRRRRVGHRRSEALVLAELPCPRAVLRHRHILDPGHGDLRRVPPPAGAGVPGPAAALDRFSYRPVIIIVSLVLGLWLVGNSIYYLIT